MEDLFVEKDILVDILWEDFFSQEELANQNEIGPYYIKNLTDFIEKKRVS